MADVNPPGIPIERGKVHEFGNAILSEDPLYHDEEAAKRAGLPSVVAPPTFLAVGSFYAPANEDIGRDDLDRRFVLHGGRDLEFERPIFAGEFLTKEMGEIKRFEKQGRRGGVMKFVETETVYRDQNGQIVVRERNTTIQTEGVVSDS
jgi:acyl dehydratase